MVEIVSTEMHGSPHEFRGDGWMASSPRGSVLHDIPPDIVSRSPVLQVYIESSSGGTDVLPVPLDDLGKWASVVNCLASLTPSRSLPLTELLHAAQVWSL